MSNAINNLRRQGVQSNSMEPMRGTPKTIRNLVRMEFYAFEFVNEKGEVVRTNVTKIGNTWWHDPTGPDWAARITQIDDKSWLGKAIQQELASKAPLNPEDIPHEDAVDVMGSGKRG